MSDLGKISFVKGSLRYKRAPEQNINVSIPLGGKLKELDEFQRTTNISLSEVYNSERQKSTFFHPSCKFQFIFSNAYYGYAQPYSNPYAPYNNNLFYYNPEESKITQVETDSNIPWPGFPQFNEFSFVRTDLNVDGYTTGPDAHIQAEARNDSFYNWSFYVSYAYENNPYKVLEYDYGPELGTFTWQPINGLPYIMNKVLIEGKSFWQFRCPVKHNLQVGESVRFSNVGVLGYDGTVYNDRNTFQVYSLGDGSFNSELKIFNIVDTGFRESVDSFEENKRGQFFRITDPENPVESQSTYYIRRHRIINNYNDAIVTQCGFEQNAFRTVRRFESADVTPNQNQRISVKEDSQSYNVSFNNSIDINNLIDNQNRPISELYVTIINRGYFGYFNPMIGATDVSLKQGWDFNIATVPSSWWIRSRVESNTNITISDYNIGGLVFRYNDFLSAGDIIDGDLCEWNSLTQEETVLSSIYHKFVFNPFIFSIGGSEDNPLGYLYQPLYPIKIRQFSDYIEEGDKESTDGYPTYAYYSAYNDKLYWRDLYPYGYVDADNNGVDFPFFNGRHYPYKNFIFRLIPEGTNVTPSVAVIPDPVIDECE
jgi:hypothetical protein